MVYSSDVSVIIIFIFYKYFYLISCVARSEKWRSSGSKSQLYTTAVVKAVARPWFGKATEGSMEEMN
jgi:hypothetical protein